MDNHDRIQVCGNPERQNGSIARWDNTSWDGARWAGTPAAVLLTIHGPSWAKDSIQWACNEVAKACAVQVSWTDDSRRASILIAEGNIDGPGGTLAWMELPYGPDRQLGGKVDTSERWHLSPGTAPARGLIHLGAVLLHEILHGLGVEHIASTQGRALLNPMYSASVLTLMPLDIEQLVLRYGEPVATPTPDPVEPAPGQVTIDLSQTLAAGRYTLVKT